MQEGKKSQAPLDIATMATGYDHRKSQKMTSPFYKLSIASKDLTSLQCMCTPVLQLRSAVSAVHNWMKNFLKSHNNSFVKTENFL